MTIQVFHKVSIIKGEYKGREGIVCNIAKETTYPYLVRIIRKDYTSDVGLETWRSFKEDEIEEV